MIKREKVAEQESPEGTVSRTSPRAPETDARPAKYKADDLPEALKLFMQVYAAL